MQSWLFHCLSWSLDCRSWSLYCFVRKLKFLLFRRCRFQYHFTQGFNKMFNPPTHSETWFRNTRYWVFSFSSDFGLLYRRCHCWFYCLPASANSASTESFALDHWILYAVLKLSFAKAATDKTCNPGRWTVLWRIYSLYCVEEFDFNSSSHTASSWCVILLLIVILISKHEILNSLL